MDIDRFIVQHQNDWNRLDALVTTGRRSINSLTDAELDELLALYQATSAHLSVARTQFDDVTLSNRLSQTIGGARGLIYRSKPRTGASAIQFFKETFPAAAWTCRKAIAMAALLMFVPAITLGVWTYKNGDARNALIDEDTQQLLAEKEFAGYYQSEAAEAWAFELLTHNIEVSVLAYAGSALGGVFGAYTLFSNGANLGVVGAVMHSQGAGAQFWGLIIPHGLIELTSVCLAAGAGLRIAWAIFIPGDRTRMDAVGEEGLRSVVIVMGTMVLFVVAGFTEAFVTPSGLPTFARVAIGIIIELCALTWLFGVGRNVASYGISGKFGEPTVAELRQRELDRTAASHDTVIALSAASAP